MTCEHTACKGKSARLIVRHSNWGQVSDRPMCQYHAALTAAFRTDTYNVISISCLGGKKLSTQQIKELVSQHWARND